MNTTCPGCRAGSPAVVRNGSYFRAGDSRHIQRFRCRRCQLGFSAATATAAYRQKKRRINAPLRLLLCGQVTQREAARILGISRTTVARRIPFLAARARARHERLVRQLMHTEGPFRQIQFDELISFEHSKCKPLSVAVAVVSERRFILDLQVSQAPASGPLAARARRKYGPRPDRSAHGRHALFARLSPIVDPAARIDTDEHGHYPALMRRHFPHATHARHKSRRACIVGFGEMKAGGRDPLFWINHTLAMFRAHLGRLARRTWCTTKRPDRLEQLMQIYRERLNEQLMAAEARAALAATSG